MEPATYAKVDKGGFILAVGISPRYAVVEGKEKKKKDVHMWMPGGPAPKRGKESDSC